MLCRQEEVCQTNAILACHIPVVLLDRCQPTIAPITFAYRKASVRLVGQQAEFC